MIYTILCHWILQPRKHFLIKERGLKLVEWIKVQFVGRDMIKYIYKRLILNDVEQNVTKVEQNIFKNGVHFPLVLP